MENNNYQSKKNRITINYNVFNKINYNSDLSFFGWIGVVFPAWSTVLFIEGCKRYHNQLVENIYHLYIRGRVCTAQFNEPHPLTVKSFSIKC